MTMNDSKGHITAFLDQHFLHFNAASLVDAARSYKEQLNKGSKMLVSLAGAMSTAELGKIFAEIVRKNQVHIISCTGANLEEDVVHSLLGPEPGWKVDQDFIDRFCSGMDAGTMPDWAASSPNGRENFRDYILGAYDGTPKTPDWASAIFNGAMRAGRASCIATGVAKSPNDASRGRSTGTMGISNSGREPAA